MIDILMATYNGEKFVAEQIESILAQTYTDWRLLISDDGSSDDTVKLVDAYVRQDSRIQWESRADHTGGSTANFMHLLHRSTSEYAMFCDQDDVWLPNKVESSVACLKALEAESPNTPAMVFTNLKLVDRELNTISDSCWGYLSIDPERTALTQLMIEPIVSGCTMILNADLRELVLGSQDPSSSLFHDWWISLVAASFGRIDYVSEPMILYRQHGENVTLTTKRTTAGTLRTWRSAHIKVRRSIKYAQQFMNVFGSRLTKRDFKRVRAYAALKNAPHLVRLPLLLKSHAWMNGLVRKIGQAVITITMDMHEETD